MISKKILLLFCSVLTLILAGCTLEENNEGVVVDKHISTPPPILVNSGNVLIPIPSSPEMIIEIKDEDGKITAVSVKNNIYHSFEVGDYFKNVGLKVYKNNELIDQ